MAVEPSAHKVHRNSRAMYIVHVKQMISCYCIADVWQFLMITHSSVCALWMSIVKWWVLHRDAMRIIRSQFNAVKEIIIIIIRAV